ncbi:DUF6449 domain-containing protein [Bacillota bacterium LX-D]|nr:DUF6449 domain-containing protein [Bacillota bacterium LX-D]
MKPVASFFKPGVFLNDFHRLGWIGVLHTLGLLLLIPVQILMIMGESYVDPLRFKNIFYYNNQEFQSFLVVIMPIILGMCMLRYLQVKNSVDMIHSLPIKRSALLGTHTLAALLLLFLPVLIVFGTTLLMQTVLNLGSYYTIVDLLKWAGFTMLIETTIYLVSIFIGMAVGMTIVQGAVTLIFLFLPAGLLVLFAENLKLLLYGFDYNWSGVIFTKISPVLRVLEGFDAARHSWVAKLGMTAGEIIAYIALCLILYLLSGYLYGRRKLEAASQSIAFPYLRPVFKYGVTFCTMLVGGLYFAGQHSYAWLFFGYLIGSLFGYFIAEMIIKKSVRVLNSSKGYVLFCLVILILFLGIKFDILGYERRMPELSEVKSIYFADNFYSLQDQRLTKQETYVQPDNIANIYAFHKALIQDKNENGILGKGESRKNVVFVYQLQNGKKLTRGYSFLQGKYADYFKPIEESEEYKKARYDVLNINFMDVEKITISPEMNSSKQAIVLKPEEIKEAIEMLKKDIHAQTYEQMHNGIKPWASINFLIAEDKLGKYFKNNGETHERSLSASWEKSYRNFALWLQKKGYLKEARILPAEVSYISVEEYTNQQEFKEKVFGTDTGRDKSKKRLYLTEKTQLEYCLNNYQYIDLEKKGVYYLRFYNNNKEFIGDGMFDQKNAPEFITDFFFK